MIINVRLGFSYDIPLAAQSESIRAYMAEFLASDAEVSPVAVHIDARQVATAGYSYRRPADHGPVIDGD